MSSWRYFAIFRIVVSALLILIQLFFYRKALGYIRKNHKPRWYRAVIHGLFATFNLPMLITMALRLPLYAYPSWLISIGVYPFYLWHFSMIILFVLMMIGKLLKVPFVATAWILSRFTRTKQLLEAARLNKTYLHFDQSRRVFVRQGITALGGATLAGSVYGILIRDRFEILHESILIRNLPDQFEGFTIGLISDIHSSVFMTLDQMRRYVTAVNDLGTDLITIPGDFVNSMVEEVYPFAQAFSELKAPHGVYGVFGNHDHYAGQIDTLAKEINGCGIKLLQNENVAIQRGDAALYLLGIDDVGSSKRAGGFMNAAMAGTKPEGPKILLCHRPYYFDQAANRSIDLTLAGHTHGGQIVFMKIGKDVIAPARIVSPYVAGNYTIAQSHMYVSRGIGTVGVPIRLNCPPEITKITLIKA